MGSRTPGIKPKVREKMNCFNGGWEKLVPLSLAIPQGSPRYSFNLAVFTALRDYIVVYSALQRMFNGVIQWAGCIVNIRDRGAERECTATIVAICIYVQTLSVLVHEGALNHESRAFPILMYNINGPKLYE